MSFLHLLEKKLYTKIVLDMATNTHIAIVNERKVANNSKKSSSIYSQGSESQRL